MYDKEITITVTLKYDYNLDKIKELIKQIVDVGDIKKLEVTNEK
jgi:hypothetical protein